MRSRTKRGLVLPAVVFTTLLIATACAGSTPSEKASTVKRGGVYRVGVTSFGFSDGLDPTGEYTTAGWVPLEPLTRNLVMFKYAPGAAGTELVPDLATSVPTASSDGLTYTFHLRPDIMFGPPVNRAITSTDIAYAFERINTEPLTAGYAFYYQGVIEGMESPGTPKPEPISGIETPDPQTIVFHLTRPTTDFVYWLAFPATAPIPPEVGKCFTRPGDYGRDIVSSGPYMIQGAESVDVSSCSAIKPMSGFDPSDHLVLVRNPSYDPNTDPSTGRLNYVDAIDISIITSKDDIFNKVQAGELDASWLDPPPPAVLNRYLTDPSLKDRVMTGPGGGTYFIAMNLSTPPFDDIHVRKAVNYIIDKEALLRAWGGPTLGEIATHLIPPFVLSDQLTSSYDPYKTSGEQERLSKAQAEMRLSTYDSNQDGECDASVCSAVVLMNRNVPPWTTMEPIVVADLAKIGIKAIPRELEASAELNTVSTPKNQIPMFFMQWAYDYPEAYTYMIQFVGDAISAQGNYNFSLVGLTETVAKSIGTPYPAGGVPSVDTQIKACEKLPVTTDERLQCWINLDKYLMEEVVPSVPYLWNNVVTITGSDVTHWEADPFSCSTTFTQVAVSNDLKV